MQTNHVTGRAQSMHPMHGIPLLQLGVAAAICLSGQCTLSRTAAAQDTSGRMPDSVRHRLLGCGTHGPTLERRVVTREVVQALAKVSSCPEGPEVIAGLWASQASRDSAYLGQLLSVSSIADRRVAAAMMRILSDRSRPIATRLHVLGSFLKQLTGVHSGQIVVGTLMRTYRFDSAGRVSDTPADSLRGAMLGTTNHPGAPLALDPALRAEIVAAIERIAADSSDSPDMRLAAAEVAKVLSQRSK